MNRKVIFGVLGLVVILILIAFVVFQGKEYKGIKYRLKDNDTLVKSEELYLSLYKDNKDVINFLTEEGLLPSGNVEVRISAPSDKVSVRIYRGEVNKTLTYRVSNHQLGRDKGLQESAESYYQVIGGKIQEVSPKDIAAYGFDGDFDGAYTNVALDVRPQPININVNIVDEIEKMDGLIKVNLKTNLPDKSELLIGLDQEDGTYRGQSKTVVMGGSASSEWFSNKGEELNKGKYNLTISMSIAPTQPEEVRKVIGSTGEKLEGKLVTRENNMSSVRYEKVINLEDGAGVDQKHLNSKHRGIVKNLYDELMTEYSKNLNSYNELEFGQFRANWNRRRNAAQSQLDSEGASQENSLAIRELIPLETELKNKLAGKKVDEDFIKQATKSIQELLK